MSTTKKDRFKHGPESEQFNKFKGQRIKLRMLPMPTPYGPTSPEIRGKLIWVDLYTMGVQFEGRDEPAIVYKGPGMIIELAE
jgi:hypothetical protein